MKGDFSIIKYEVYKREIWSGLAKLNLIYLDNSLEADSEFISELREKVSLLEKAILGESELEDKLSGVRAMNLVLGRYEESIKRGDKNYKIYLNSLNFLYRQNLGVDDSERENNTEEE